MKQKIRNAKELEFCVFCIENIATRLGINPKEVYTMIAEQSDILNDYIVPEYEMLHTQKEAIKRLKFEKLNMQICFRTDEALSIFYHSDVYQLMRDGVSDMHCMSDGYLVDELIFETL